MNYDKGLKKMAELVAATGVSKQTIHFYLREGLLSPPVRTSRNMAYYDDRHVIEIRTIKELQEKHYYPLSLIKMIMEGKRNGDDIGETDHLEAFDDLFVREPEGNPGIGLSRERFIEATGLTPPVVDRLFEADLLAPVPILDKTDEIFSSYDVEIGQSLKTLLDMGLIDEDLMVFKDYLALIRREAELAHDRIIANPQREHHPPLTDIFKALNQIKLLLNKKAYRELITEHRHQEPHNERREKSD